MKTYIGIDNGVSGSIAILFPEENKGPLFWPTPVRKVLDYTKEKAWCNRVDFPTLLAMFESHASTPRDNTLVVLERPMVNPTRFTATKSALRALEATLIAIEQAHLPMIFVDSKQWQKVMLPHGLEGPDELKAASLSIGQRLFPSLTDKFKKDADSILMAEWARREEL